MARLMLCAAFNPPVDEIHCAVSILHHGWVAGGYGVLHWWWLIWRLSKIFRMPFSAHNVKSTPWSSATTDWWYFWLLWGTWCLNHHKVYHWTNRLCHSSSDLCGNKTYHRKALLRAYVSLALSLQQAQSWRNYFTWRSAVVCCTVSPFVTSRKHCGPLWLIPTVFLFLWNI